MQWSESWTKCSREGKQSRRYTVLVYPTRTGKQCPGPETRACVYPGPQTILVDGKDGIWSTRQCVPTRRLLAYTGETHETFAMPPLCQYDPIKLTVGDVVVFKKRPEDTVTALPSQWHYNECNFTDGGWSLRADDGSSDTEVRYTIGQEHWNKRLYLASGRDTACSRGQRVLISVDDFKQGTLAEVIDLVDNKKAYTTEEGAIAVIERIWCFEDHCPAPAMGWYEGNAQWSKVRCKADAYSLLGFVYRKRPKPQVRRAEEYYKKALELVPQHCEATSYMGELYIQVEKFEQASETYARLLSLVASEKTAACEKALKGLGNAWTDKGWCPPPANSKKPCFVSSRAVRAVRPVVTTVAWLASCVVLVTCVTSAF